jgi:hypothetical protein
MREIRTSGSEGGGAESNQLSLPLWIPVEQQALAKVGSSRSPSFLCNAPGGRRSLATTPAIRRPFS